MAAMRERRGSLRRKRPEDERTQMDRYTRRPDLRFAFAVAGARGGLCLRGLEGEVRKRLRGRLEQGDESRPLRARGLISHIRKWWHWCTPECTVRSVVSV